MQRIYPETLTLLGLQESRTRLINRMVKLIAFCQDQALRAMLEELRNEFRQTRTNTLVIPIEDLSQCRDIAQRIKVFCLERRDPGKN